MEEYARKLHKAEVEEKRLKKQIAEVQRNERTHRLCTRGAYLKRVLIEPELFTDEDVFRILDYAFITPFVKDELAKRLDKKRREAAENAKKQAAKAVQVEGNAAGKPTD